MGAPRLQIGYPEQERAEAIHPVAGWRPFCQRAGGQNGKAWDVVRSIPYEGTACALYLGGRGRALALGAPPSSYFLSRETTAMVCERTRLRIHTHFR